MSTTTNIEPEQRSVTLSDIDDPSSLRGEIALLGADALDKVLAAIIERLIAEMSDADAMLAARLQQIQEALRPITGTPARDDSERLRRRALWQRLDAVVDLREVARAAVRKHTIEQRNKQRNDRESAAQIVNPTGESRSDDTP
jgi:hypothetical protein